MSFTTLATLVKPKSKQEDARRREFILNVLLLAVITLLTLATMSSVLLTIHAPAELTAHDTLSVVELLLVLGFFVLLYTLSRRNYARAASFLFVGVLILFTLQIALRWGTDVPSALLLYALTVTIAGILISSRWAFIVAALFFVLIPGVTELQKFGVLAVDVYWRTQQFDLNDAVLSSVILAIIAIVSWLSNREIERSLIRARASEAALKVERDLLEVRVQERTAELRKAEMERIAQSYRFVEFGRIASGIFHDLTNPLTAISLTIDNIAKSSKTNDAGEITTLHHEVAQAQRATNHMQNLMQTMRRHLANETHIEEFSLTRNSEDVISMLQAYARQSGVGLELVALDEYHYTGNPVALTQILTNLVSNAIESYDEEVACERKIVVVIDRERSTYKISVQDNGPGIPDELAQMIFEPFVSTKVSKGGLGIGLSLVKELVERELQGTIHVSSVVGEGTLFTISFPIRNQ